MSQGLSRNAAGPRRSTQQFFAIVARPTFKKAAGLSLRHEGGVFQHGLMDCGDQR